jgi:hypothetical protein
MVQVNPLFGGTYCLNLQGQRVSQVRSKQTDVAYFILVDLVFNTEEGGSKFHGKIDELLPHYMP